MSFASYISNKKLVSKFNYITLKTAFDSILASSSVVERLTVNQDVEVSNTSLPAKWKADQW